MRGTSLLVLVASIVLIVIGLTFFTYAYIVLEKIERVPMSMLVMDHYGVNLDTDGLHFGGTAPGGTLKRDIMLSSPERLYVNIKATGPGAEFITVSENNFALQGEKTVTLQATVPYGTSSGWYNGTLIVSFKRWNI